MKLLKKRPSDFTQVDDMKIISDMLSKFRVCRTRLIQHLETASLEKNYSPLPEIQAFAEWMEGQGKKKYGHTLEWQTLEHTFSPILSAVSEANNFHKQGQKELAISLVKEVVGSLLNDLNRTLKQFDAYLNNSIR